MSWLLNSMEPSVSINVMWLGTAKEIGVRCIHLRKISVGFMSREFFALQQEDDFSANYARFRGLCEELNLYQPLTPDLEKQKKQREEFRVYKFLAGLKPIYEPVRVQILGSSEVPSLNDVYSRLRRVSISAAAPSSSVVDRSALVTSTGRGDYGRGSRGGRSGRGGRGGGRGRGRGQRKCTHCGYSGHTVETCWDLHGKPAWANQASYQEDGNDVQSTPTTGQQQISTPGDSVVLSREEYSKLVKNLQPSSAPSSSTATLANSGTVCVASVKSAPWVIYSGASDHMTGMSSVLSNLEKSAPCSSVTLADGTLSSVSGRGLK